MCERATDAKGRDALMIWMLNVMETRILTAFYTQMVVPNHFRSRSVQMRFGRVVFSWRCWRRPMMKAATRPWHGANHFATANNQDDSAPTEVYAQL